MKITGTNLSALPVTVMIGNQQVSSTPSDTEITFTVPANLSGDVKVILKFLVRMFRPAECEVTVLPAQIGDITNYVLENTSSPFAIEGNGLKGWNTNSIFYGNPYVEKMAMYGWLLMVKIIRGMEFFFNQLHCLVEGTNLR